MLLMVRLHVKYNGSACAQDKISCGTFIDGSHSSACVPIKIFMKRLHTEHILSACVQDRASLLARPLITHKHF